MTATADDSAARTRAASKPALAFKITAFAEAVSWTGLLIGMFFKWIVQSGDLGVRIFGPIHGTVFILYVLSLVWISVAHKWPVKESVIGLVSAVPPFMTVWFERRAERLGLLSATR